jgi:MFS family permease
MTYTESSIAIVREFLEEQHAIKTKAGEPTFKSMFSIQYKLRLRAVLFYQFFRLMSGLIFFNFYAVKIFDEIGLDGGMANLLMTLGYALGAVICIILVGTLGRKPSIVFGIIGQTVAFTGLIIMSLTEWYSLLYPTCMIYTLAFAIGGGASTPWMVETIPSIGIGIANGFGWLCSALVGLFTPIMIDGYLGPTSTMVFYCFWGYIGIFALDWVIIETKGKQTDEIEQEYMKFKYRPFNLFPEKVAG